MITLLFLVSVLAAGPIIFDPSGGGEGATTRPYQNSWGEITNRIIVHLKEGEDAQAIRTGTNEWTEISRQSSVKPPEPAGFTAEEWDRIANTFTVHMKNGDTVYAKPIWTELAGLVEVSRKTNPIPQLAYSFPISNLTHKVMIIDPENPAVKWQWDNARENNRLAALEEEKSKAFWRTNKSALSFTFQHYPITLHATTNDIELGYRADGVVVWRVPPEAK